MERSSSSSAGHEEKEVIKEPLLKIDSSPSKGGLKTLTFILGSGTLETVAVLGILPNMPLYLINEYHMDVTTSSSILFYWGAVVNFIPVIGAVIADSYVGRFNMMGFGSLVCIVGLALLWSTTVIPGGRPPECDVVVDQYCSPAAATAPQLFLLCMSFVVMAVGAGCFKACSAAFGVDQLGSAAGEGGVLLERYFSWYMAALEIGILIAYTCIVYVQDKLGWRLGFGVCVVVMVFSALSLFLGIPFYVNVKTKGNLIVELAQVIVAAYHKRHVQLSSSDMVFHHNKKEGSSSLIYPTENLRFLNKACLIQNAEHELTQEGTTARDPWRLCTVEQVENLKSLLKVIPVWSTGVLTFATMNYGSFSILQAKSMDRKIIATLNFEVPAGSLSTISILSVIIWVILYRQVILPLASRLRGGGRRPTHFTTKQRMGAGILVSCICMMVSAVVEGIRRRRSSQQMMSALWLVPQHVLLGIVEGLNGIAQFEFYISELPRSMSSIASCIILVGGSVGNLLSSFLMSTVDSLSKTGGHESWISTDINKGRYDYYFWCLSGLSMFNFLYFLLCCRIYGPCRDENKVDGDDEENVLH